MKKHILLASMLTLPGTQAMAVPFNVLWWDSTQSYGAQNAPELREKMPEYLSDYDGGSTFSATYVRSRTAGALATELATNSYDVIVFDSTSSSSPYNAADLAAVQQFYQNNNRNVLLDGSLYIRSIAYNADTVFPGPGGGMGVLTLNSVYEIANRGGGIMIGTDHNCCQVDANAMLNALIPGASFSGIAAPSTDGVFYGAQLLNNLEATAPINVLTHWATEGSQGIPPVGAFTDFLGNSVTLYSQVDIASTVGGPRTSRISSSWQPGAGSTGVGDDEPPPPDDDGNGNGTVPEPGILALLGIGLLGMLVTRRRQSV